MVKEKYNVWWYWHWKQKFCCYKCPIFKNDVNIDKICISKKIFSRKKIWEYFIGYLDDFKIKV